MILGQLFGLSHDVVTDLGDRRHSAPCRACTVSLVLSGVTGGLAARSPRVTRARHRLDNLEHDGDVLVAAPLREGLLEAALRSVEERGGTGGLLRQLRDVLEVLPEQLQSARRLVEPPSRHQWSTGDEELGTARS